jgi:hypothetical protein
MNQTLVQGFGKGIVGIHRLAHDIRRQIAAAQPVRGQIARDGRVDQDGEMPTLRAGQRQGRLKARFAFRGTVGKDKNRAHGQSPTRPAKGCGRMSVKCPERRNVP